MSENIEVLDLNRTEVLDAQIEQLNIDIGTLRMQLKQILNEDRKTSIQAVIKLKVKLKKKKQKARHPYFFGVQFWVPIFLFLGFIEYILYGPAAVMTPKFLFVHGGIFFIGLHISRPLFEDYNSLSQERIAMQIYSIQSNLKTSKTPI